MLFELLGKGILVGLIFGIPAGAIGALTIQRTLEGGFFYGLATGLGSSFADVLYAGVGVFGITVITGFLTKYEMICSICGAVLIIIYGIMILRKKADDDKNVTVGGKTYVSGFLSAFIIAIMNPATVLSFLVAFSTFGLNGAYTVGEGAQIIVGVLLGTGCWWAALSGTVAHFKDRVAKQIYRRMNILLGGVLIVFGIAMIGRCLL